jgi:hypothetical protein
MSLKKISQVFITCDRCGGSHGSGAPVTAMAARIAAGIDGWSYLHPMAGGTKGRPSRSASDFCPPCTKIRAEGGS